MIGRVGSIKRQRLESSPTLETRFDRDTTPIHADCIQKPNTMRTTSNIDYLATFRTRRDRCRELLDLSNEQDNLIERDDYTGLLDVLGRKQRILSESSANSPRRNKTSRNFFHIGKQNAMRSPRNFETSANIFWQNRNHCSA